MSAILSLRNVSCGFGPVAPPAVQHLSLDVLPGELLVLVGPSGCGKSTTLRLIAGLEVPDDGEIVLGGRVVAGHGRWVPPEERGIGLVFQDYALFPHLTAAQNVAFGLHRLPAAERPRVVQAALALVGMQALGGRYPHELSGGQQQRIALARALAPRPVLILLDEPFSNLDPGLRAQMRADLRTILQQAGATAVLVTHDQSEALALADRLAVLRGGRLQQVDTPQALFADPHSRFVAEFLGHASFLPGVVTPTGVQTELGEVRQPVALGPGTAVEVLVRDDDLALLPCAGAAQVLDRVFEGTTYRYQVSLPSGCRLTCRTTHTTPLCVGAAVTVQLAAGHPLAIFALPA